MRAARLGIILTILSATIFPTARAELADDFASGLGGWSVVGDAAGENGEAVLRDRSAVRSMISQATLATGILQISFDFRPQLSPDFPVGAFPDSFFASIYSTTDANLFNPDNGSTFTSASGLFDLDAAGLYNLSGTVGASAKGSGWFRFDTTVTNTTSHLALAFELVDEDTESNDSVILIDNVRVVPEPGSLGYGLFALLLWQSARRLSRAAGPCPAPRR